MGYEYRSSLTVAGLPLVHVAFGRDPYTGRRRIARGVVAIGQVAQGGIAIGQITVGVLAIGQIAVSLAGAVGQVALGVFVIGQFVAGGASALGQFAAAHAAMGGLVVDGLCGMMPLVLGWVAAALWLAAAAWPDRKSLSRLVDDPPMRRLRDARPGPCVVAGRVVPIDTLEAPVTHRACVAYDVRRVLLEGPPRAEWACADFWIEDATGRARVVGADVELHLKPVARAARATVSVLARAHGAEGEDGRRARPQPVEVAHERVLLPGDFVVATGFAIQPIDGEALGPDDGPRLHAVLHAGAPGPVLVTNRAPEELRAEASVGLWLAGALALGALLLGMV